MTATTTTHSGLYAMLNRIQESDYLTAQRLSQSYTDALRIDTTYGTDLAPAIVLTIEQIATDLPPIWQPPF